jgi:hypothetical protein
MRSGTAGVMQLTGSAPGDAADRHGGRGSRRARHPPGQIHSAFLSCTEPGSPGLPQDAAARIDDDLQVHPVPLVLAE